MIHLPDVNVLVAMLWERHVHHPHAVTWFANRPGRFATCTITQLGFVRVSSHPRFLGEPLAVVDAVATLSALCDRDDHVLMGDDRGFLGNRLVPFDRLVGHRQVTDAQLIAIARAGDARMVTFDAGLRRLGGESVELLA